MARLCPLPANLVQVGVPLSGGVGGGGGGGGGGGDGACTRQTPHRYVGLHPLGTCTRERERGASWLC